MRNCIRDIFTYWRNIMGRQQAPVITGLPFEFVVTQYNNSMSAYNGYDDGNLIINIQYTNGTTITTTRNIAVGQSYAWYNFYADVGTTIRVWATSGTCVAFTVNGVFIFDNR